MCDINFISFVLSYTVFLIRKDAIWRRKQITKFSYSVLHKCMYVCLITIWQMALNTSVCKLYNRHTSHRSWNRTKVAKQQQQTIKVDTLWLASRVICVCARCFGGNLSLHVRIWRAFPRSSLSEMPMCVTIDGSVHFQLAQGWWHWRRAN